MPHTKRATRRAGTLAVALAVGMALGGTAAAEQADQPPASDAPDLDNLPGIIFDDSIGDWMVDRLAGNDQAGSLLYQGPAREIGGLGTIKEAVTTPDGTVYIACRGRTGRGELVKVTPDGTLRLVMEKEGRIEGRMEECQAGRPIWNPKENTLYLTGPNCLRKVVEKPDGTRWVEVVAGIPNQPPPKGSPPQDGPARQATFESLYRGVVCNGRGTFYWLEGIPYGGRLRRIENGIVSTVPLKRPDNASNYFLNLAMGGNACGLLSLGEDDDTLYISDYYGQDGYVVLKCDVKTGLLTRLCGINREVKETRPPSLAQRHERFHGETDGPALTHASGNSGIWRVYNKKEVKP